MMTQENHVLESDALSQPKRKLIATLEKPSISMPNGGVFGNDDDDEEDGIHVARKKIKLFEITREVGIRRTDISYFWVLYELFLHEITNT